MSNSNSNSNCKFSYKLDNTGCTLVNEYGKYKDLSSCMNEFEKSYITDHGVKNPPSYYWMNRNDGTGRREYFTPSGYLTLTISPVKDLSNCKEQSECKQDEMCLNNKCHYYSNAEIYNGTCCDSNAVAKLDVQASNPLLNKLSLVRRSLYELACNYDRQPAIPNSNCLLNWTPNIIIDDPITQTKQALQETVLNTPYLYSDVYQTVTCKNLKNGSRGFGYWNTSINLNETAIAWFIQLDGVGGVTKNGFYIQIQVPTTSLLPNISFIQLPDLDEKEHTYEIIWRKDSIKFYIDHKVVHIETKNVPNVPMAYHNWVDNSLFGYDLNMQLTHILQESNSDRSNIIKNLKIDLNHS
jgi:hypothetical protein